jgi:hypothetical protein
MNITSAVRESSASLVLILLGCGQFPPSLRAGAWNQDPGHGQLIVTASYFQVTRAFDGNGASSAFPNQGKFRQFEINPYLELGISRRNTVVVNAFLPVLRYTDSYGSRASYGLGNVEFGWQRRLSSLESRWVVSTQLTFAVPAYSETRSPAPGNHQTDTEGRFAVGHASEWGRHHLFWDAEAAFRYRAGAPADQFRSGVTGGIETGRLMCMGQFFGMTGLRNGKPLGEVLNPNAQSDFDLYKAQASLVARLGGGMRIQAGLNRVVAGRSAGQATGFLVAVWHSF